MIQIGEVIGLLNVKAKDETKKLHLVARSKSNPKKELRSEITNVHYNNDDGVIVISNAVGNSDELTIKTLVNTLFLYQSDKKAVFTIYNKSGNKLLCEGIPKFSDIKVNEMDEFTEIIIYVDKINN